MKTIHKIGLGAVTLAAVAFVYLKYIRKAAPVSQGYDPKTPNTATTADKLKVVKQGDTKLYSRLFDQGPLNFNGA